MKITPVFFDLETQRTFDEVDKDYTKLGFSVAVLRTQKQDLIYRDKSAQDLLDALQTAQLIVGHNHIGFDFQVLKGYGLTDSEAKLWAAKSFDVLLHLQSVLGQRISLDHLSKNNLKGRPGKLAPGEQCPLWFKQGKLEKIQGLCVDDVHRLAKIFGLIVSGKPLTILQYWLTGPDKFAPTEVVLDIPEEWKGAEWA